jgi:hypothetical protein
MFHRANLCHSLRPVRAITSALSGPSSQLCQGHHLSSVILSKAKDLCTGHSDAEVFRCAEEDEASGLCRKPVP